MSFLNLAVLLALTSVGPIMPAGYVVSHFQVPSNGFMNVSNSLEGVGGAGGVAAGAAAGAAAAGAAAAGAAAAGAGAGFGACASAAPPTHRTDDISANDRVLVGFMIGLLEKLPPLYTAT